MRVLFDKNVSVPFRLLLPDHAVGTVAEAGWDALTNGRPLRAAEDADHDFLLTCDQNIPRQQSLAGRRIGMVLLDTTLWSVIRDGAARISAAIDAARPGECRVVPFAKPPLRRRPYVPPGGTP